MTAECFTIGVLARRSGCSADTIRYYERLGLIPQVRRTEGGHRLYDIRHLKRIAFIRRSRDLALPLEQIRTVLNGLDQESYDCAEARALLVRQLTATRQRIKELRALAGTLNMMVDACGGAGGAQCAVLVAMFAEEETKPGAHCCAPELQHQRAAAHRNP